MSRFVEHHTLALLSCNTASLELLSTQPPTDAICELRDLLESQFDIIDCIIQNRHYGSDELDCVIGLCNEIVAQVKEFEES